MKCLSALEMTSGRGGEQRENVKELRAKLASAPAPSSAEGKEISEQEPYSYRPRPRVTVDTEILFPSQQYLLSPHGQKVDADELAAIHLRLTRGVNLLPRSSVDAARSARPLLSATSILPQRLSRLRGGQTATSLASTDHVLEVDPRRLAIEQFVPESFQLDVRGAELIPLVKKLVVHALRERVEHAVSLLELAAEGGAVALGRGEQFGQPALARERSGSLKSEPVVHRPPATRFPSWGLTAGIPIRAQRCELPAE